MFVLFAAMLVYLGVYLFRSTHALARGSSPARPTATATRSAIL